MPSTLVIGAAKGIGFEFSRQLLAAGCNVLTTAKEISELQELIKMGARPIELDFADDQSLDSFCNRFDAPDLTTVIHATDFTGTTSPNTGVIDRQVFDYNMNANVFGPIRLIPQLAPMIAATAGRYAFISADISNLDQSQPAETPLFRAAVAALNMIIRCAALEHTMTTFLALSSGLMPGLDEDPKAHLTIEQSVKEMLRVIAQANRNSSGHFLDYASKQSTW